MKTGRKNNNSGFSLVELIIVIAIMAVLVGVMATSITSLTGRKVRHPYGLRYHGLCTAERYVAGMYL